jgi:hypothetical protein
MSKKNSLFPPHRCISEPQIIFHPDRIEDRDIHPLKGLYKFGPYSRSQINHVIDPIRLAVIAPFGEMDNVDALIDELNQSHSPEERKAYLIDFPGFSRVFGLNIVKAGNHAQIELPQDVDKKISAAEKPHLELADILTRTISAIEAHRNDFEVFMLYLPIKWEMCFYGDEDDDFDLHDYLKAITAARGIPLQIIREDKAIIYECRCSVAWRLSLAIYCKAGGIPWKLAGIAPDVAFIGLSYAIKKSADKKTQFVTCCSQVFDADGTGLEFLLYETEDVRIDRENPFLSRNEMRRVMARSLRLYQKRNGGRSPRQVFIHKTTHFKPMEIDGCFDAFNSCESIDLIQVQQNVCWRGVNIVAPRNRNQKKGIIDYYPCHRGSYITLDGRSALLWTQGNAPIATGGKNYFKEGKSIPSPLLLTRHAGHGTWEDGCRSVLDLTKMNWNHDGLYDKLPVTLSYSSVLANIAKRMKKFAALPYQFRFFM